MTKDYKKYLVNHFAAIRGDTYDTLINKRWKYLGCNCKFDKQTTCISNTFWYVNPPIDLEDVICGTDHWLHLLEDKNYYYIEHTDYSPGMGHDTYYYQIKKGLV